MSVHLQMLGRQLPCTLLDLLSVKPMPLPAPAHDALVARVEGGQNYADLHYKLGLSHMARQELGLARKHLKLAVDAKPKYAPARLALAAVCDLLAQHNDAVDQLDAAIGLEESGVPRAALACAAGFCLERVGAHGAAAFRYEQALAESPDSQDAFAHYRLAAIFLAHNELERAAEHHYAILEIDPQEQAVRTSLAHLLQLLGRHKEAVWEYEKALCMEPDSWELQLELADQLERMGNTDAAVAHLGRLVKQHPEFPDLRLRLANLHSERGEDKPATDQYDQALAVHPNYLDCHIALARHQLRMGRVELALIHFQRAMGVNDQNVETYAGLAVALHRLGKADQAQEMLAAARKIAGNSDVLLSQLGRLELEAEAAADADEAFDPSAVAAEATETDESSGQRAWLGDQVERYRVLLDAHPTWTDVRVRCGMLLKLLGRTEEAAACFERAVAENPAYIDAWVQLGLTRHQTGDDRGAIEALETAIQIKPEYADLHYKIGLIYCGQLEFDLAMERLEEAASLNKKNPEFQRQLFVAIEAMQMTGRRSSAAMGDRVEPLSTEAA
ncbi:MAG TPA: tetratricopeptide repeat protein [Tepidisphaeraceae bacterium]|nr:tetratricopeptide repeat protein [Tepidisphaeraceae bacterium]